MRTLIYARYSSQLQNPRSVEDQLADCRARCAAEGWTVVGEYHDSEISGAAGIADSQRPGIAALLARLELGAIDQVLTEHTDRIARHLGDSFAVRERLEHAGARLFTLMQGTVDEIVGTVQGLFDSKYRKDLAHRVRRGQRGNIAQGRSSGGVAYGYRRVVGVVDEKGEPVRGLREIDPVTSEVVRRIFRDYAFGLSARQIAGDLDREGITAPRGGHWKAGTIAGNRHTRLSILANPIYIGQLVYGRTRMVVDPKTRAKSMRPGTGETVIGDAPHLRLIDDDLWDAVQRQLEARAHGQPHRQRRPKHLLSGLGVCGVCGSGWVKSRGRYFGCSKVLTSNACSNRRLIDQHEYERRVLAELAAELSATAAERAYLNEYVREHTRRVRELGRERKALERRRDEAGRKVERLVAAIAEGAGEFKEVRQALVVAKADHAAAEKALAAADALPTIALHPGLARQYHAAIENLAVELADESTRREAAPRLRKLIARIVVRPRGDKKGDGVDIEVIRHIDEIAALAAVPLRKKA